MPVPDISWCRKGGARGYVTMRPMSWDLLWKGSPYSLLVNPGREFESSVPKRLHWLWSPDDPFYLRAALFHDVALENGARVFEADMLWATVAITDDAPLWRTIIAYVLMILRRIWHWARRTIILGTDT